MDEMDNTFANGRIWTTENNYQISNQQRRQIAFGKLKNSVKSTILIEEIVLIV